MTASRSGNVTVVKQLLAKGADVNAREHEYNQTALMWAVAQKHAAVVEALLESHAEVDARAKSYTQTVKFTPEQGSKNVFDIQQGGYTSILFAARVGDLESAKLLLKAGANVNDVAAARHQRARCWPRTAAIRRWPSTCSTAARIQTLQAPATPRCTSRSSGTTVKLAADLLAAGADPNAKVQQGSPSRRQSGDVYISPSWIGATPIWLAARYSEGGLMRMLVAEGRRSEVHSQHGLLDAGRRLRRRVCHRRRHQRADGRRRDGTSAVRLGRRSGAGPGRRGSQDTRGRQGGSRARRANRHRQC